MRVLIATTQVPFVRGGAEMLAEHLQSAIENAGHAAEIVALPFKWYPPDRILDHMLAARLMKIDTSFGITNDLMIGLKFPAYLIPHPNKVMWLLHQYRSAYECWSSPIGDLIEWPEGQSMRAAIIAADDRLCDEFRSIYTLSAHVSERLQRFNAVASVPLYHPPPGAEHYHRGGQGDYLLVPSRIDRSKRQDLVLDALALTREPVKAVFIGAGNAPGYETSLQARSASGEFGGRVEWRGAVGEAEKHALYAECLAVVFVPIEEDYGYVTLEAMLSGKAVVTCTDSGGPTEFIVNGEHGLVSEPTPQALARAFDLLWADRALSARLGRAAYDAYQSHGLSWPRVVSRLLG